MERNNEILVEVIECGRKGKKGSGLDFESMYTLWEAVHFLMSIG